MYRKAQLILMVVALTMGMLLFGIGPAQADNGDDDANNCLLFGLLCLEDDDSTFGDSIFSLGD